MRGVWVSSLINSSNYSKGGRHVRPLMALVQGPHSTQGSHRLKRRQETEAQLELSANKQSHLSLPFSFLFLSSLGSLNSHFRLV